MTCSIVSFGRFSIVSTLFPESVLSSVTHERASLPSMSTLHAPQCPVEQPSLLPFMHSTLRRYFRRGMRPPQSAVIALPFNINVTFSIWLPFPHPIRTIYSAKFSVPSETSWFFVFYMMTEKTCQAPLLSDAAAGESTAPYAERKTEALSVSFFQGSNTP